MKILHINTYNTGGAATGAIRQHQALLAEGITSKILFLEDSGNRIQESYYYKKQTDSLTKRILKRIGLYKTKVDIAKTCISELGLPFNQGGSYELFSTPYSIYEDLNHHPLVLDADIINIHWISGFIDFPSFFTNIKKPIVWTLHDMQPYMGGFHYHIDLDANPQFKALETIYLELKKDSLKAIRFAIVGNSNWNTRLALNSNIFEKASSFNTVYYPLNTEDYNAIDKQTAKKALGLPVDKTIIGFACEDLGNPRKGLKLLLKAINLFSSDQKEKICCLAFGKENQDIKFEKLNLIQLGPINNLRFQSIAYSAMDLFIIPSIAEAFGLTALEAMACGTPVIGADTGGIPEMVIEDSTGYLYESGNIELLSKKILKFLAITEEQRRSLGENAQQLVNTRHHPKKIASEYIAIYDHLLSK